MAQRQKDVLRGFLVPYPITSDMFWSTEAIQFDEQEIIAGQPIPESPSKLQAFASGNCSATTDLQVTTSRSGIPPSCEFTLRDNETSNTIEHGFNPTINLEDIDSVVYAASGASMGAMKADALSFDDGSLLTVVEVFGGALSNNQIRAYKRDKDNNITNSTVTTLTGLAGTQDGFPCICELEDRTILLLHIYEQDTFINANTYRSSDRGASFSLISSQVLNEYISNVYTVQKVRMRSVGGQVLLSIGAYKTTAASTNKNVCFQYASIDSGGNFTLVTEGSKLETQPINSPELIIYKSQFTIVYISDTDELSYVQLPHAFFQVQDLISAGKQIPILTGATNDFAAGTVTNMTSGEITACELPEGDLQVIYTNVADNTVNTIFSSDGITFYQICTSGFGATAIGKGNLFFIDSSSIIDDYKLVKDQGRAALVTSWTAATATNDNSVWILYLGGYSNVSYPSPFKTRINNPTNRIAYQDTYLPIEKLSDCSIFAATGTGTEILATGYSQIQVTTSQTDKLFSRVEAPASSSLTVRSVIKVDEDDSGNAPFTMTFELEDPPKLYRFVLKFFESEIKAYNNTTLLGTFVHNSTLKTEVLVSFTQGKVAFWYRYSSNSVNLKTFTNGLLDTTISDLATGFTAQTKVQVGIQGSPSGVTAQSRIYSLFIADEDASADFTDYSSSNDNIGRKYPVSTKKVYLTKGVSLSCLNGASFSGESWNIQGQSEYPIGNALYQISPSRRVTWRSEAVASGPLLSQRIPFLLTTNNTTLGNDIIGIHLSNINFSGFTIQYHNGVLWQSLSTVDCTEGMNHGFIKSGNAIKQNPASITDRAYYFFNELKDCIAQITVGATTTLHRITGNTEGVFGDSSAKTAIIRLDTEPSGNGTVKIIPRNVTAVCSLNGVEAKSWAILINGEETIDKYYQIGLLSIGEIAITGKQYSKGRRITIEAGSIQTITPDRTVYSRNLAPSQRTVEVSWSDGVDISGLYDTSPDPDYYKSSSTGGALAVSNYNDAPYLLEGVLREVQGSESPLVYLPHIATDDDIRVLNRRHEHMLGILDSEIQIESVTGDELLGNGQGEVMRVATITMKEVL